HRPLFLWTVDAFDVKRGVFGGLVRRPPTLARHDVAAVPLRPVVLRTLCLVVAVPLLGFLKKLSERWDIQAESSTGKPRLDLLEEPAVSIGIAKRRERPVAGMIGRRTADSITTAVTAELGPRSAGVKDVADLCAAS